MSIASATQIEPNLSPKNKMIIFIIINALLSSSEKMLCKRGENTSLRWDYRRAKAVRNALPRGAPFRRKGKSKKPPSPPDFSGRDGGFPCIPLTRQSHLPLELRSLLLPIGRVLLRDFPNHPAGIPGGDHPGGDRFCDHRP